MKHLLDTIQKQSPQCIGVAQATEDQSAQDFDGPCFFAENSGQRYRIDTSEPLVPEAISTLQTFFESILPEPDWQGFVDNLPVNIFGTIAQSSLSAMIVSRITRLADGDVTFGEENDNLILLWNQATPSLDEQQRTDLVATAQSHNIPIEIDEDNLLTVV
ncbi:MAG: hypothetical protein AAF485_10890 [Chloroflexota bacterium]